MWSDARNCDGLARLPHQVDEVGLDGGRPPDGRRDPFHQQVGNHAGEQRAGPEGHHIRFGDRRQGLRQGLDLPRNQADASDPGAAAADARLAHHFRSVFERGFERHVGGGRRIDASGDLEHFRRGLHGLRKIAHHLRERHQEQVAEAVSLEAAARLKPVLEQARQQRGILAQRHHAIADVARGQHVELAPQPPGAAAVVGDGHDGGDVHRGRRGIHAPGVVFEPFEQRGEPGAAADGDDPER